MDSKKEILETANLYRTSSIHTKNIEEPFRHLVIAKLNGRHFAFPHEFIKAIQNTPKITYVPGMPDYILGIAYLQGNVECIIEIGSILQASSNNARGAQILLTEAADHFVGITVDSVEDMQKVKQRDIHAVSENLKSLHYCFLGEFSYQEQTVLLVDLESIFARIFK